ncbi:MAG TPA: conjugal transfer protein TraG [Crenotrichaceae bacterium]|nr:conjugal transfer protein TraG [Crenotrichaceae bacterium]
MYVSSYLELYLILFSWHMYTVFWDIAVDTGLAYLPFIGVLFHNFYEPSRSQEAKDASGTSLRRMELDLIAIFTVIVLATQPLIPVNYGGLNYTIACNRDGTAANTTVNAGATGTSYDATFTSASLGGTSQRMPIWWAAVHALSNAFNNAAIAGIPCSADIRLMRYTLNNTPIKTASLRRDIRLFFNDCYFPALGEFLDRQDLHNNNVGSEDLNWPGSLYLLRNIYPKYRARQRTYGFDYDPARDVLFDPLNTFDGKPTCSQWWTGQGHFLGEGLRVRILNELDPGILTWVQSQLNAKKGIPAESVEDTAIRTMINKEKTYFSGLSNLETYTDKNVTGVVNRVTGQVGAWLEAITFYPKMQMIKAASPIIQATVLMLLVIILPFILVFSSYKISTVIFMSIVFFAVRFWTVLWAIAHWLDNRLIDALEPSWFAFYHKQMMIADDIINFVTAMLFIVMPLFWLGALSWIGFRVGSAFTQSMSNMNQPAESAGTAGGNAAKTVVSKGVNKIGK